MASTSDRQLEDKRLLARVEDALEIASRRFVPHFIGFLDERQSALVTSRIAHVRERCFFFGGHEEAERQILGVFPNADDVTPTVFPIVCVAFLYGMSASLSHRDVLGSLLGCGIARDKIGDILCGEDRAVVFVHEDLAAYVADSVTKIGRVGVHPVVGYDEELPVFHRFESISGTVASPRLDAVLKILLGVSREQASERIRDALVQVDHQPVTSASYTVRENQVISVRGSGRYKIDDVSQMTKKGRLVIQARRYV